MGKGIDKSFLARCLDDGMSLIEIGKLVDRKPGTVGYWVRRHGLVANGSTRFRPGKGLKLEPLRSLVDEGRTLGQIGFELGVSINTVCYWIEKHGLPKPREVRSAKRAEQLQRGESRGVWRCRHHGETEFIADSAGLWRCRLCRQDAVARRRRRVKRILVEEAGGGCLICGYDRVPGALQFHHVDPATKRFTVSSNGYTISIASAREEAAKCVLLCANCHAEVEAGITLLPSGIEPPVQMNQES